MRYRIPDNDKTRSIVEYVRKNYSLKTYSEAAADLGMTCNSVKYVVYAYGLPRMLTLAQKKRQAAE